MIYSCLIIYNETIVLLVLLKCMVNFIENSSSIFRCTDLLNYMAINIMIFTPRDEHSQGECPNNSRHRRDCTYKLM